MTPRKNRTEIFEEVIYYCAIPIDSDNLYDKVTRYIQVNYLILLSAAPISHLDLPIDSES